ncbi:MAG: YraN family protein [Bacillota bacterium]
MEKQELGDLGERLAADYLKQLDYQIRSKNYRCRQGEIDIIAADENYLIFIEVKTKRNLKFGMPQEEVDWRKQKKIKLVAQHYISQHPTEKLDYRFDVVGILFHSLEDYQITHLKNAF